MISKIIEYSLIHNYNNYILNITNNMSFSTYNYLVGKYYIFS